MLGMLAGRSVFSQLMDLFPLAEFRRSVERYGGNYKPPWPPTRPFRLG